MTTNDLTFRELRKEDIYQLPAFFEEVLGQGKYEAYWLWKYFHNPSGEHMAMIGMDGSILMANIGVIPCKMKLGTGTFNATQGVDTAVRNRYRQKKIFFHLEKRNQM